MSTSEAFQRGLLRATCWPNLSPIMNILPEEISAPGDPCSQHSTAAAEASHLSFSGNLWALFTRGTDTQHSLSEKLLQTLQLKGNKSTIQAVGRNIHTFVSTKKRLQDVQAYSLTAEGFTFHVILLVFLLPFTSSIRGRLSAPIYSI